MYYKIHPLEPIGQRGARVVDDFPCCQRRTAASYRPGERRLGDRLMWIGDSHRQELPDERSLDH
ncbi:MAG: hypothetical protein H6970_14885 [Gammaproteobacteria bacterium]|nr:hypothetical protein [Gammaproteobacteria bacterium]MCP5458396.1 hypothetical protein [Gammaproteobacteria bacterium]